MGKEYVDGIKDLNFNLDWLDICKGIGILLVVIGHYWIDHQISTYIYMFHMPLFFLLSGYLFKPKHLIKEYLVKKSINLILPYISFLIIIGITYNFETFSNTSFKEALPHLKILILGGSLLKGPLGVFWFITCLYFTQQIYNLILCKFDLLNTHLISAFLLVLAYINQYFFNEIFVPYAFNVCLFSIPIFHIGYLLKKYSLKFPKRYILFGLIPILITYFIPENTMDMKYNNYGIIGLTLLSSILIIIPIIIFSKMIVLSFLGTILKFIGKCSLLIMFLHQPIFYLLPLLNIYILTILGIALPILIYLFLKQFSITRLIFLGSYSDLKEIKNTK